MTFDRLLLIDRLREAGIDEPVARAHADAVREALPKTVATKADLNEAVTKIERRIDHLDRKIEIVARDLTIRAGAGPVALGGVLIAVKFFG